MLNQEVSREEISAAFLSLHPNKAPEPDGFNGQFFRSAWSSIGEEFISGIKYFFDTRRLLKELNAIVISLVPKVTNPSSLNDYRPISCCSTIYKCISKVIANRLKLVLHSLIDKAQSAFIKGRHISDNILLTQELMRNYHHKDSQVRGAIKVDLTKEFDYVRWEFILDLLSALRFPERMIHWIRACITSPRFSININGSLEGFFSSSRGIRQGDPLSPYLFVIVMDALSMIISKKVASEDHFTYHWRCSEEKITHLCFADDLILFCGKSLDSVVVLKQALDLFLSFSGLTANHSKSDIFVAGSDLHFKDYLLTLFGFQLGSLSARHLGVPLISTKLSARDCKILLDKIVARIKNWTTKHLSYGGRLQLIKSVLFSLQVYWMGLFILPKKVTDQVDQLLRSFLWSGTDKKLTGAKVSWESITCLKSKGG